MLASCLHVEPSVGRLEMNLQDFPRLTEKDHE